MGEGVSEQELELSSEDIARLDAYLLANAHPDHRDYRYQFSLRQLCNAGNQGAG